MTNPAALQPPGTLGLVLFRFTGLSAGLVARHHDRAGLGPFDGPSLGVIGIDANGAVLVTGDPLVIGGPVAWVRPPTIEAAARWLRALEDGAAAAEDESPPFGRLCRASGAPRLVVGGIALDAGALERLARAMMDRASGVIPRTWPVRFGPAVDPESAGARREAGP